MVLEAPSDKNQSSHRLQDGQEQPTFAATCRDSKQAPHVSPRRKDRSKGSKKGVGSSCCTRKDFILVLLQISAVFWVVFTKHPPKNFHLHFPLPTALLAACALSLRMCYASRGRAASMRKRLRCAMLQYRRCCPCCPYVTYRSYIGRPAGSAAQSHPMHAERHSIQSLSRHAGCHCASHAARKASHLAADDALGMLTWQRQSPGTFTGYVTPG